MAPQHPDRFASRRLADTLRAEIASGACPPGSRMPSYRQLRDAHGIALNTAQAAIRRLAAEGLVEIRPASGTYVRGSPRNGGHKTVWAELADLRAALRQARGKLEAAESMLASVLSQLPAEERVQ